jgi:hypothetical protein
VRFRALVAELVAELGGDLPPTRRLLVEQLARLKLKAKTDDVRATNAMLRITKALGIDGIGGKAAGHMRRAMRLPPPRVTP